MGGKEARHGLRIVKPVNAMEVYPLPEPQGRPEITDEHFKAVRPSSSKGPATFGIYGDPGR